MPHYVIHHVITMRHEVFSHGDDVKTAQLEAKRSLEEKYPYGKIEVANIKTFTNLEWAQYLIELASNAFAGDTEEEFLALLKEYASDYWPGHAVKVIALYHANKSFEESIGSAP